MTGEDQATVRSLVSMNLFGRRALALTLTMCVSLPAVAIVYDELGRMRGGNEPHAVAWAAAGLLFALGAMGLFLYLRARNIAGSSLYTLLTSDAGEIQTLTFIRIVNRPFVHVHLGTGRSRDTVVVFRGGTDAAYALFTRIAPQAQVLTVPDPRPTGPSRYER